MKRFECQTGCGKCCTVPEREMGFVFLTPDDIIRLSEFFKLPIQEFLHTYTECTAGQTHIKGRTTCMFLKGTLCDIHEARPVQCSTFPFWRGHMPKSKWENLGEHCPGIGKGPKWSEKKIKEELELSDKIMELSKII